MDLPSSRSAHPSGQDRQPTTGPGSLIEIRHRNSERVYLAYAVASGPVASGWRPWTISEKRGLMKTLIDAHSDRILGFTAFGPAAGELMGTVQLAMLAGLPYTTLRDAMFAHPTMTEGLKALFMSVPERLENHAEQLQHARTPAD